MKKYTKYKIKKGDTLIGISKKFKVPVSKIAAMNLIKDINYIRYGDELLIEQNNISHLICSLSKIKKYIKKKTDPFFKDKIRYVTSYCILTKSEFIEEIEKNNLKLTDDELKEAMDIFVCSFEDIHEQYTNDLNIFIVECALEAVKNNRRDS